MHIKHSPTTLTQKVGSKNAVNWSSSSIPGRDSSESQTDTHQSQTQGGSHTGNWQEVGAVRRVMRGRKEAQEEV